MNGTATNAAKPTKTAVHKAVLAGIIHLGRKLSHSDIHFAMYVQKIARTQLQNAAPPEGMSSATMSPGPCQEWHLEFAGTHIITSATVTKNSITETVR
jgi:hypothetical protein